MLVLSRWPWFDDENGGSWGPPPLCRGAVDLTSLAQIAEARRGEARGWGIFLCDAIPTELPDLGGIVLCGDDFRDAHPDGKLLDAWESILGWRPQGDTIADLLWDQLTRGADPANLDRNGMLVPDLEGRLQLWLGGLVREERFVYGEHSHTEMLKCLLQCQLDDARIAARSGEFINPVTQKVDEEYHLRIADALAEKYAGLKPLRKAELFAVLKPADWDEGEQLRPHSTTITDSFNRADQSGLGTSSEGWSWSAVSGVLQIASNQAKFSSGDPVSRADADLSSADHYAQIERKDTTAGSSAYVGPCCRFSASASTYYLGIIRSLSNPGIYKRVAGSFTRLITGTAEAAANTYKLSANGTTISQLINGALDVSVTDSSIAGNLRTGLQIGALNCIGDNFQAGDLSAGLIYTQLERGIRGLHRGLCQGMK